MLLPHPLPCNREGALELSDAAPGLLAWDGPRRSLLAARCPPPAAQQAASSTPHPPGARPRSAEARGGAQLRIQSGCSSHPHMPLITGVGAI